MTDERHLGRLGRTLGLPIVAVDRIDQGPGRPRIWTVQLADGRRVMLGDSTHAHNPKYLTPVLEAVGAEPISPKKAKRAVYLLHRACEAAT